MLRLRSNWIVIEVDPIELVDVICAMPGICAICRSSGCATDEAMVSGLAPGRFAWTWMVGKSTCGSGATGSSGNATSPTNRMPAISNEVAMGYLINGAEMLPFIPAS